MKAVLIAFSLWCCLRGLCLAQGEQDNWNPVTPGPATTWTATLCGKGKFVIQPFIFDNITRGIFNDQGHYEALPHGNKKSQLQEQLFTQYGITDRLEIDALTVYQENFIKQDVLKAKSQGFEDSHLIGRYCLLEAAGLCPHVTGLVGLKVPTGKYQHANPDKFGTDLMGAISGGGSWDPEVGIIIEEKLKPFLVHFDAIYSFPQEVSVDEVKTKYSNYLNYDVGVEYVLPRGFNLMVELNGFAQGDRWQDGARMPLTDIKSLTFAPGIGWSNDKIQILLAYQRVFAGTNTDANDSVVATFIYTF
ncbi:MAG: hypothetical protein KGJ11_00040 [Candidatus Omnitrophica bacterium]|nr:hypothetical protein [Candidatus Omnitrophota bacterium]